MLKSVQQLIRECLETVKERIKANIAEQGRTASGRTAASLEIEDTQLGGVLRGSSSFLAIERGRKGGRVPKGFFGIILQWIKDKGVAIEAKPAKRASKYSDEERAQRSLAGAIAYTIMTKGTRLYRTGGYNDIYDTVIKEEIEKLRPKIVYELGIAVRDINQNMAEYAKRNN